MIEKLPIVTVHVYIVAPNNIQTEMVVTIASSVTEETSFIEQRRDYTVSVRDGSRVRPQ